ncbi:MAG: hypothetical protein LAO78_04980 [Acidobacteriia bacterium]|nr:hypothetical protein [Terriglobia bacterium]
MRWCALGRALVVWLVFIGIESVLGSLRGVFLEPRIGAALAQRIGLTTGSVALLIVTYLLIGWVRAEGRTALLEVGVLWVALTFTFEMVIGHLRGRSWRSLLADYDIAHGGLMSVALALLLFAPLIAVRLRR